LKKQIVVILAAAAVLMALSLSAAIAELERVGPVDPEHGYPMWYQDKTGLTLEFGAPLNQAELDGGWLSIASADVPSGTAPETFPDNFAGEHFYWTAGCRVRQGNVDARLILALEAAFATEEPVPGDQIVFGRIRIRIDDLPFDGTYTVYTPYGMRVYENQVAGERLIATEDVGICTFGLFEGALKSGVGPFLLPSNIPGGPELPPVTGPVPGKLYIADPARSGPVTGSPLPNYMTSAGVRNPNIFRVEGPNGFVLETVNFALTGRIYTDPLPNLIEVDRASYTQTASLLRLDVFTTGLPTLPSRLPGAPIPSRIMPVLSFYNAPPGVDPVTGDPTAPTGETEIPMFNAGNSYWAQSQPLSVPTQVTIKDSNARDATGQLFSLYFGADVTDHIDITQAFYDPTNGGSLTVTAQSSDEVSLPTLTLEGFGDLTGGQIVITPLAAPPEKVRVLSSANGSNEMEVRTDIVIPGSGDVERIGELRNMTLPQSIHITSPKSATSNNPGIFEGFYIEEPDRAAGIKVIPASGSIIPGVAEGDELTLMGILNKDANEELCIFANSIRSQVPGNSLDTLGVNSKAFLNTEGLLVTIWGNINTANPNYIYVDDGSGLDDGTGNGTGIRVVLNGISAPTSGFVIVTGVSGKLKEGDVVLPVIRPRFPTDIR